MIYVIDHKDSFTHNVVHQLSLFDKVKCTNYDEIDIVCKGEGENALTELCNRIEKGLGYHDIPNLWFKKDGQIISNPTRMVDMDSNPLIDFSGFEDGRFYRPMGGTVYRMFPVETHRGCPYKFAF